MSWAGRIGGVGLTGLGWAAGWAPIAVLIGVLVDPQGAMDEMWGAIGAYPGFLCGVLFWVLLQVSRSRDLLGELSIMRVASLGAISGALVGALPSALVATGDSGSLSGPLPASVLLASLILMSSFSGVATRSMIRLRCTKTASQ